MTNPNDSAFPLQSHPNVVAIDNVAIRGLTKREWLAGMALQGLLSEDSSVSYQLTAENAIGFADALLAALGEDRSLLPREGK